MDFSPDGDGNDFIEVNASDDKSPAAHTPTTLSPCDNEIERQPSPPPPPLPRFCASIPFPYNFLPVPLMNPHFIPPPSPPVQLPRIFHHNGNLTVLHYPNQPPVLLPRSPYVVPHSVCMQRPPTPNVNHIRIHPTGDPEAALRLYLARPQVPLVAENKIREPTEGTGEKLEVEDALSYLDKVKALFGERSPGVYAAFLDIMKEFRSQSINTESVIDRVTKLFRGYPQLIMGFNAFLPPNYRIQCLDNETLKLIKARQLELASLEPLPSESARLSAPPPEPVRLVPPPPESARLAPPPPEFGSSPASSTSTGQYHTCNHFPTRFYPKTLLEGIKYRLPLEQLVFNNQINTPLFSPNHVALTPTNFPPAPPRPFSGHDSSFVHPASYKPSPSELTNSHIDRNASADFSQAINYVNKIKTRFHSEPLKYRQFLDVLHAYQKQQAGTQAPVENNNSRKPQRLTEQEVYQRVEKIFGNHSDLLQEFTHFLSSTSTNPITQNIVPKSSVENAINEVAVTGFRREVRDVRRRLAFPNSESKKGIIIRPRVRPADVLDQTPPVLKKRRTNGGEFKSKHRLALNPIAAARKSNSPEVHVTAPILPPVKPTKWSAKGVKTTKFKNYLKKFNWFGKVREHLKYQDLFTSFNNTMLEYRDGNFSTTEVKILTDPLFRNEPNMMRLVQDFLELCEKGKMPEPEPLFVPTDPEEKFEKIDFSVCRRRSKTYCAVPIGHVQPKCSGQTDLCREVLNDEYVSAPISIDESHICQSVPHRRRTQYEEFCLSSEEDRFEHDVRLEWTQSAIDQLEVLKNQIDEMPTKKRKKFQLDDRYNVPSPVAIENIVTKAYGDQSSKMLKCLKRHPNECVSVVLNYLNLKRNEWEETRNQFNLFWRKEVERHWSKQVKNMATRVKQLDSRSMSSAKLVQEVESVFKKRAETKKPALGAHLTVTFPRNVNFLENARDLVLYHLRRQSWTNPKEKLMGKKILKQFLPSLMGCCYLEMSDDEDAVMGQPQGSNVTELKLPTSSPESDESGGNGRNGNLEKFLVKHQNQEEYYRLLFVGENWYVLLRHFQVLCQRLAAISNEADQLVATRNSGIDQSSSNKSNNYINLSKLNEDEDDKKDKIYPNFLQLVRYVLDGHLTINEYEEKVYKIFGNESTTGYTIDRLVHNLVRRLQSVGVVGSINEKCYRLYYQAQRWSGCGGDVATAEDRIWAEIAYYREARKILDKEKLFRVVVFENSGEMSFEMMNEQPPTRQVKLDVEKFTPDPLVKGTRRFLNRTRVSRVTSALNYKTIVGNSAAKKHINLYWIGCLEQAKEVGHFNRDMAEVRYEKMYKWHEDWLLKMTTRRQRSDYDAWFKGIIRIEDGLEMDGHHKMKPDMKVTSLNPFDGPPYRTYKRYTKI